MPYFGRVIIEWEENKVIRPHIKFYAVSMIVLSIGATCIFTNLKLLVKAILIIIGLLSSTYIITRNSEVKGEKRNLSSLSSDKL